MAATPTQLSQQLNLSRSMAYYPPEATHMPIPEQYQLQQPQPQDASSSHQMRLGKNEIWWSATGFALYTVTRESAGMPSFLSSKPLLTVRRLDDGHILGTIRFHSMSTTSIDLTLNGLQTSIEHSGFIHNRWGFQPTTSAIGIEKWYWKRDKASSGGVKLEDSKKDGTVLARIKGDLLSFESSGLNSANCDEILLSAIAMAEAARRQGKGSEIADLADAIASFADSSGGDGGGGDGGGGGGGS